MSSFIEDIGLGFTCTGPVIRQNFKTKEFSVSFGAADPQWLTDQTAIVGPCATIGAANRQFLHQRLDEFINTQLEAA